LNEQEPKSSPLKEISNQQKIPLPDVALTTPYISEF